ncbi:ABC transporter ATP-binding protein [Diaphorobacter ruginosibacter]|uniref:ABC transporter ATP-binding protein n=1 Tax=Diaphorobacter ruginosibacter TaxID=1715720 RepID=A0A7G9RQS1_9BURK|nr:ABC transporter ATP-binding protein [Diaphorobacter ruginosibacter]QNN57946.1 ABC transporter ATP-binding protein [Diaphorobacter ruginosibacter]
MQNQHPLDASGVLNGPLGTDLRSKLATDENVLATLQVDLTPDLRFQQGLLALTSARFIFRNAEGEVQEWPLGADMSLRLVDHGGVGTLELHSEAQRLALWRFRLGLHPQALALMQRFEKLERRLEAARDGHSLPPESDEEEAQCPTCHTPLPPDSDECPACARQQAPHTSTWVLLRLWRFAKPYKNQLLLGFLLTLAATGAQLVAPYLTIPIMDKILIPFQNGEKIDPAMVTFYLGALLLSALLAWMLGWARTFVLARVSERIGSGLRTTTYNHLLKLSLDYYGSKRTGDLMARIGAETDRINLFLSLNALDFATDVLMMMMTAAILFSINPWLALATLVPLPFIAWMIHLVRERLRTGFEKIDRVWSEVTNVLADTIPGIRVVKAFAQEKREADRFADANLANLQANDKVNKTWSLFTPTVTFLTEVGLLIVWAFGIWLVAGGSITVGVLTAFIAYIGRFYSRLDSMSRIVSVTQKAAAGAKRIFDILDHVSNVPDPQNPVKLGAVKGALTMEDVSFRYGSRSVIKHLDLQIKPGEMIGLVGHSGSGKSTLVNLICRFYDVSEGSIQLDGVDVRRIAVSDFRRNIGLVLQEPFLFFGTIAENIAYGKPEATREEIVAAARAAHAHEFILRLPHGYDSLVGERGQGLSGGERQRISIARALLIDPRILILDEATSAVDTETEKEIQKALDNLVQGRTTIAIAHRLSTLRKADRLVVMDRGEIVEVGPHDELMACEGAYWRLYMAQARRAEEDAEAAGVVIDAASRVAPASPLREHA